MRRGICSLLVASALALTLPLALPLALTLTLAGCKGPGRDEAKKAEADTLQLEAKVLATVGSRAITVGDFLEALSSLDDVDRARFEAPARRKELLQALIETEALAQEAIAQGLDKTPAVAQELRAALRDAMLQEIHKTVPRPEALPEADVRAYYTERLGSYSEPERRRLQAIVVPSDRDAKRAVSLLGHEPSAAQFGEVAKAQSTDASAKSGGPVDLLGDVGFVSAPGDDRGTNARIPAEVRTAAHALKGVGSVSSPVAAQGVFWIVRVASVSAARARTFEEVDKTIRIFLAQELRVAAEKKKLLTLASEAKIALDPAVLERVLRGATATHDGGLSP